MQIDHYVTASVPTLSTFFKSISKVTGLIVLAIGTFVAIGWLFNIQFLKTLLPNMPPMVMNSAVCFMLAGIALLLILDESVGRNSKRRTAHALSAVILAISLLVLFEHIFNVDLGIDRLLAQDVAVDTASSGRMPPHSALNFVLIGSALFFIETKIGRYYISQWFAITALLVTLLVLVGYAYGIVDYLYSIIHRHGMAFHSAITFFLLSIGILFARPDAGLMRMVSSDGISGFLIRRLLPIAVFLPLALGWLRLKGEHAGLYSTEFGLLIFATSNIVILVIVIWRYITERKKAEEELMRSERLLNKAQRIAKIGCWEWEALGNKVTLSEELLRILKVSTDAIKPKETLIYSSPAL